MPHHHPSHYLTLRLLPDPEFPAQQLLNALYAKLHRALCDLATDQGGAGAIGVSFPQHSLQPLTLGTELRLHAPEAELAELMTLSWLSGMRDHLDTVPPPQPVPPEVQHHRIVRRVQPQASPQRQGARWQRRHPGESLPDQYNLEQRTGLLRLPHLHLRSRSTGHAYPLYIQHGPLLDSPATGSYSDSGNFNRYGLSQGGATVPWF